MKRKWAQKAFIPSHRGLLHKQMGVPQGQKIPEGRLKAAAHKPGLIGRRARAALNIHGKSY